MNLLSNQNKIKYFNFMNLLNQTAFYFNYYPLLPFYQSQTLNHASLFIFLIWQSLDYL